MWCKDLPHKMYVGRWPTFHGPMILSYILKTTWWINVVLVILISVTQTLNWNYYVDQWPIFHGPAILPYIFKTIWWTDVIIGILDPYDANFYQIKYILVSDLHFMVHWFCLISWRLFDGLMLYWRYWYKVTQPLNWNYICRSVTYISWSSNFALYLEDYLMDKCHGWNIGPMLCKWMYELGFYVPSTVFQSFRDDERVNMKGSVHEAPFKFGKNLASSGIRTRDPVIRSRER